MTERARPRMGRVVRATAALALCLGFACGPEASDGRDGDSIEAPAEQTLVATVGSFDLAAGEETRFLIGLLSVDDLFISHGEVDVSFAYLGREEASGEPEPGPEVTASFLPVDGETEGEGPKAGPPSAGRGVYSARVEFDKPGIWEATVTADMIDGETLSGTAAFEVLEEHVVPAPGERALETDNLTIGADDAPKGAIDSRAETVGKIPDEVLHRTTIADSIRRGRPALVVFSTPVYCQSRFCGPVTDVVEELSTEYGDRADFIHVEIWRDFENQVVNKAAADWLLHDDGLQEPWVFLIDGDGRIAARWDNIATRAEIAGELEKLPRR